MLIGYVFDKNGYYDRKYYFEETIENIAKFITQNYQNRTTITDRGDELICKSLIGGYLDVANEDVLHDLLPVIIEFQSGKKFTPIEFYMKEPGVYFQKNVPVTGTNGGRLWK